MASTSPTMSDGPSLLAKTNKQHRDARLSAHSRSTASPAPSYPVPAIVASGSDSSISFKISCNIGESMGHFLDRVEDLV